MSSEQQVPGNSELSNPIEEIVVKHPDEEPTTWVSRHSRTLWGVGAVSVAVIIGVSIRALFSKKE